MARHETLEEIRDMLRAIGPDVLQVFEDLRAGHIWHTCGGVPTTWPPVTVGDYLNVLDIYALEATP